MATEAVRSGRPRPWLLIALAIVVGLFAWSKFSPSASVQSPPPPQRAAARAGAQDSVDAEDLKVRLDGLKTERPEIGEMERNPFRFQPRIELKPPQPTMAAPPPKPFVPPAPTGPLPPPPIPLKFIGIVQADAVGKVAAFTDCRATFQGREGSVIDGRYRLVRIGVTSVEMEYLDGRGRTTIRMSGQECVGR